MTLKTKTANPVKGDMWVNHIKDHYAKHVHKSIAPRETKNSPQKTRLLFIQRQDQVESNTTP